VIGGGECYVLIGENGAGIVDSAFEFWQVCCGRALAR